MKIFEYPKNTKWCTATPPTYLKARIQGMLVLWIGRAFPWLGNNLKRIATGEGQYIYTAAQTGLQGQYQYYLNDHLGNTRVVITDSGKVLQRTDYYAFGLQIPLLPSTSDSTRLANKYKFLGREEQPETGWVDLMQRMYDPPTARFLSVDPKPDVEGQESLTTYQYGYNNPIRYSDPNGDCPGCWEMMKRFVQQANSRAEHYNYLEHKITGQEPSFLSKAQNYAGAYLKQGAGNYSDANDVAVLTKGQNLDGGRATTGDRISAGIGMFIPVIGGKALKELVQGAGEGLQYVLKNTDLDLRKAGVKFNDALDAAFKATGVDRGDFEVTKWGKNQYGKSVPVEYRAKGGAEISIDYAHKNNGLSPDAPHVGWQTTGKGKSQTSGHIILDNVPSGRSADKLDRSQY